MRKQLTQLPCPACGRWLRVTEPGEVCCPGCGTILTARRHDAGLELRIVGERRVADA